MGKAAFFRLHRYFGLAAAAFLLVQALTGLALVFGPQFAQLLDPAGMTSAPGGADAAPSALLAAAEARYPGYRVDRLVYPGTKDGTYLVHLAEGGGGKRYVSLDRHDAAILRAGSLWRFPVVAAFNIHDQWLSGTPGTVLVSLAGLALLTLAATGLAYWWPRRGRVRKSLAVQWRLAPRLVLRQLHRTAGVSVSLLLGFMAITGLFVAIPMVLDGAPKRWSTSDSFAPRVESALALARGQFPGRAVRDVRMQGPSRIDVFLHAPERNVMAVHRVVIDTSGPRIESVRNAFEDGAPWVIALPLHNGQTFGVAGRLAVLIGGLMLAGLAATGPLMWWQARRGRRGSSPKTAPAGRSAASRA